MEYFAWFQEAREAAAVPRERKFIKAWNRESERDFSSSTSQRKCLESKGSSGTGSEQCQRRGHLFDSGEMNAEVRS